MPGRSAGGSIEGAGTVIAAALAHGFPERLTLEG
jgi:hypothetical protein